MTAPRDFLVELGTEELPPLALPELERAFADGLRAGFAESALAHGALRSFPRHAASPCGCATSRRHRQRRRCDSKDLPWRPRLARTARPRPQR